MMALRTHQQTSVYLLRHGECEGGGIFRGRTDSPLSEKGRQQMRKVLDSLTTKSISHVLTSPAARARIPAEEFAAQQQLSCEQNAAFSEIDFGVWEGQLVDDVAQRAPEAVAAFWRDPLHHTPPLGEPLKVFQQRVLTAWRALLEKHLGETILLVTHGGVIRIILADLLGMPLRPLSHIDVPHACLSLLRIYHAEGKPDWPQLVFHNGAVRDEK